MTPNAKQILARAIEAETHDWSPEQKAALLHRMARESTRLHVRNKYPTAGKLAQAIEPGTVQTPALDLIDNALEWALATPDARLAISMPPQEGKTTRVGVWGVLRALVQDPNRRCVLASYSEMLARSTARTSRNLINEYGHGAKDALTGVALPDKLGLSLSQDKTAAGNWKLAGHNGGLYAVGVGGSLTGQPAELLIIDDPLKGMTEADSRVERDKVITWWESIAQTRLAPGAPVIIIQTRWHEDDLVGHILKNDSGNEWRVLNLPAVATPGIKDSLNRPAGEAMQSARGRTAEDFARIRKNVGERVWAALYLGSPTPARGGLFEQDWFDRYRAQEPPHDQLQRIVSVDPAETGKGDEAGIVGMTISGDGRVWVTHDHSGNMQSDQWARAAVLLALRTGAGELLFEAFTTGPTYERVLEDAWRRVRREWEFLQAHDRDLVKATVAYANSEYAPDDALNALKELLEVDVPNQPDMPFVVRPWRAKGDKTARAAGTRQAASTGRLRLVGSFPELESQATQWQQGQGSPDRVDALVNGYERCMQIVGSPATIAAPSQSPGAAINAGFWSARID